MIISIPSVTGQGYAFRSYRDIIGRPARATDTERMMSNRSTHNAADILPKKLLAKLQRHCTGLIYIQPEESQADRRRSEVSRLYAQGLHVSQIAKWVGVSERQVRNILRRLKENPVSTEQSTDKVATTIPADLLHEVRQYAVGLLYVPPKLSKADSRHKRVKTLLAQGRSVDDIASCTGLSHRHIRRLRAEFAEEEEAKRAVLAVDELPEFGKAETPTVSAEQVLRRCPRCGRSVLRRGQSYCDICRSVEDAEDGDVIVVSHIPIASFDARF